MTRRDELAAGLAGVRDRIRAACVAAGRSPDEVTLIVVTKTHPAADIRLLAGLGVVDVAENREQEAAAKVAELADLPLRWHFVGQLQRNKAAAVARFAHAVHSVDRIPLVAALDRGAQRAGRRVAAFVQVGLDDTAGRGGCRPDEVAGIAAAIAAGDRLDLAGLMAVAPLGADPVAAFARLAGLAADVRRSHPQARSLSAGMSGDLEAAIAAGATHVRVGSAVLGQRASVG